MSFLVFLLFSLSAITAHAGYESCPEGWVQNNQFSYNLLKQMQGVRTVGDCRIELRICNSKAAESADGQVGDALITYEGQEYYIPLYVETSSSLSESNLTSGQREIIYRFLDKNSDPLSGDYEKDRFTMRLNYERTTLIEVTLNRRTDKVFSKFIFWELPKRLYCSASMN